MKPCASLVGIVIGLCFPLALARAEMTWRNGDRLPDPMTPAAIHARVANWTAQNAQDGPRDRHVLVRFAEPVLPKQRQTLASKGVELLQPLGQNAFFARIDAGKLAPADLERDQRISSLHEIHPNWKIHSSFHVDNPPSWAVVSRKADGQTPDRMAAYVILHSDVDRESVRSDLAQRYGLIVRSELTSINGLVVELQAERLLSLADEDAVQWIEPPLPPFGPTNDSIRSHTQADLAQSVPYELDGSGVSVLVYDSATAWPAHSGFG